MTTLDERRARFAAADLYVVTCAALSRGRSNDEVLEAVIAGGGRIIQLRDKELGTRALYEQAQRFRARTRAAGVLLIINDHVAIAAAVDADGVHLGQDDLPTEAVRRIAPQLLIGRSIHSLAQALAAQDEGADYVNIGPIFPTGTKEHTALLGPQAISAIAPQLRVPFTVMGGIKAGNMHAVMAAGARRIAVVTAVTQADDMPAAVRALRAQIIGRAA
jgi:thiamine-phosphate pyrophosphorylase